MRTSLDGAESALYGRLIVALSLCAGSRKYSTMLRTGMRSLAVPHGRARVDGNGVLPVQPPLSVSVLGSDAQVAFVVSGPSTRRSHSASAVRRCAGSYRRLATTTVPGPSPRRTRG